MAAVTFSQVDKVSPDGTRAVSTLDLELAAREHRAVVVARFPPDSPLRVGDVIEIPVDPSALQFLDLETGLAIRPA